MHKNNQKPKTMRITVSEVDSIVTKLLAPIDEKHQQLEEAMRNAIQDYLITQYPTEVQILRDVKSKFLNWDTYISVYYLGQHRGFSFPSPGIVTKNQTFHIEDRTVAEAIQKCVNEQIELKRKRATLSADLEATIKGLRTHERIRKEFPEAAEYLPAPETRNLPALNISDIQNKLKELP
jgi:hypothetical protein